MHFPSVSRLLSLPLEAAAKAGRTPMTLCFTAVLPLALPLLAGCSDDGQAAVATGGATGGTTPSTGSGSSSHVGGSNAGTGAGGGENGSGDTGSGGTATGGAEPVNVLDATYLKATNADAGDLFGVSVALSQDGSLVAVGANREAGATGDPTDNSMPDAGAVYLFSRAEASWQQAAYLKPMLSGEGDAFGTSVAMSADGTTVAVGAPFEASATVGIDGDPTDDTAPYAGAVYVFVRGESGWQQQAYIKGAHTDADDLFGGSLALSADGNTLLVGAEGEDGPSTGPDGDETDKSAPEAGAAYLFSRSGSSWQQTAYIKASNTQASDHFGCAVALSSEGLSFAVGAYGEDSVSVGANGDQANNDAPSSGAVYVFEKSGPSWEQLAYLKPSQNDESGYDGFGSALSLSADGRRLAVGAPGEASAAQGVNPDQTDMSAPYAGAAYVFEGEGSVWTQLAYLKASNARAADEFGRSLALSSGGTTLVVGAALEGSTSNGIDRGAAEAGAAYLFSSDGSSWQEDQLIKASNTDAGDRFGWSVALSGDTSLMAVAANRESGAGRDADAEPSDNSAARAGAVYLYAF